MASDARPRVTRLSAIATLILLAGLLPAPSLAARPTATVMTRNLYFGADLGPVIAATTQSEFIARVGAAYSAALATDFPSRAQAWADEIEETGPDVIGLQEAVLWRTQTPADFSPTPNATTVVADFPALLTTALEARGLRYDVVAAQTGYDVEAPGLVGGRIIDIRLTQQEVILVRHVGWVKATGSQGGQYTARLTIPTALGVPIELPWAWASVDVTVRGQSFRFATTHLDPTSGAAQEAQAAEFLAGPARGRRPMIWVGDFNSDASGGPVTGVPPMTATYGEVLAAGFEDAWAKQHPANTGLTCCFAADLRDPAPAFTSRIDLVLTRGRFEVENAKVIGAAEADRLPSGLWPSDHAGVVATLSMDD